VFIIFPAQATLSSLLTNVAWRGIVRKKGVTQMPLVHVYAYRGRDPEIKKNAALAIVAA